MSYFQQTNHTEKTLFPNLIAWRFTIYVCTYHFFKYTVVCSVRTWYPSLSQQISITISTWNATKSSIKVWVSVYCHQILAASTWCHFDPYCICPCYIHPVLECRVRVSRSQSLRLSLTHSLSLWLQFTDAICQVNALFLPVILRIYICVCVSVCLSVHPSVCLPNVLVYGAKKSWLTLNMAVYGTSYSLWEMNYNWLKIDKNNCILMRLHQPGMGRKIPMMVNERTCDFWAYSLWEVNYNWL